MRNEVISIITQYPDGKEIISRKCEIWCEKKSLSRNEFYKSYASGLNATYIFDLDPEEFSLADVEKDGKVYHGTHVEYEGQLFKIIRSFQKNSNSMEITVGYGKRI